MCSFRISVAMCVYNGSRYLPKQLGSITSQTVRPIELIVYDDASTDETASTIKRFSRSAPFEVRLFQNSHTLGPAKNFEQAIRACNGDVICLADQDDIWRPNKIE